MENPIIPLYAGHHVMIYFNNVKGKIEFNGCPLKMKMRRRGGENINQVYYKLIYFVRRVTFTLQTELIEYLYTFPSVDT